MDLKLASVKVVGNPDERGWTQIYEYVPEGDDFGVRGRLYVLLGGKSHQDNNSSQLTIGKEIFSKIQKYFYSNSKNEEEGVFSSLKQAVERVSDEYLQKRAELDVCVFFVVGDLVYLTVCGECSFYLCRRGVMIPIVKNEAGIKTASGRLLSGDRIFVCTNVFCREFGEGMIKAALENRDLNYFVETFAPLVHEKSTSYGMGALVVKIGEENDAEKPGSEIKAIKSSGRFRNRIIRLIDKLISRISERKISVTSDTLDYETKSKRKNAPLVGVILLFLLAVSIVFGVKQRQERIYRENYEARLDQAIHEYQEAESLFEIDRNRARELVMNSRKLSNALKDEGVEDDRLEKLISDINGNIGRIAGIYEQEAGLFLDLTLVSSGYYGDLLKMSGGRMIVLDTKGKRLVGVDLATKRTEVIAGPDYLSDAIDVTNYTERSFVLSSDGIREVGDEVELIIKPDEWDPRGVLIGAFGGNMYVLDKQASTIWRYPGVRLGFSEKQEWLVSGAGENLLNGATSWAIDGSIWILTNDGRVRKYSLGSPQNFSLEFSESEEVVFDSLFTSEELDYLYLLDRESRRVFVFDKSGKYFGEYLSQKLGDSNYFVVSEEERKMVFLADSKLWEIEIRHVN